MEFAFAMALLILAFFFVEETSYDRKAFAAASTPPNEPEKLGAHEVEKGVGQTDLVVPDRKNFVQTLSLRGRVDPDVPFFTTMVRSFTYFLVPQSVWVITTFGINGQLTSILKCRYSELAVNPAASRRLTYSQYVTLLFSC